MKTKEGLKKFYENELKDNISFLERYRKDTKKQKLKSILTNVVLAVILGLLIWVKNETKIFHDKFFVFLWLISLLFVIWMIVTSKSLATYQKYQRRFKRKVMKKLVAYINPDFKYSPKQNVSGKDYLDSKLTHTRCDVYNGEDYVSGVIDKTPFEFSEIEVRALKNKEYISYEENLKWIKELERRKEIYHSFLKASEDKNGDIEGAEVGDILVKIRKLLFMYKKVFTGLFFVAEFNKDLKENTFVVPEKKYANILGNEKIKVEHYGKLIKLENPKFEKIFSVYGSSEQEARYILTPTMMEAMVNVQKTCNLKMMFSFTGSKVYCAIPMNKEIFEPTVKRGIKYSDIEDFYMLLELIEIIIREMNLNTRIWTKE